MLKEFYRIQKIHTAGVIIYWICTVSMLIECFILFIKAVTPSGLEFPDEYEFLRDQEIAQFIIASLQVFFMSMGIAYRVQLAQNNASKTAWAFSVFILSLVMLGISLNNVKITRELIIFLFATLQAGAALCIYGTCFRLMRLLNEFHRKRDQRINSSVL